MTLEHLDVAFRVKSLGAQDERGLSVPDNPRPYHDGERELVGLGVNMVARLIHHMTVQSGDVANRDSSVKNVRDQSSF